MSISSGIILSEHFDNIDLKKFNTLNIAVDFDDTFSADPIMFKEVIKIFKSRGHKVYLVTYRHGDINHVANSDIFDHKDVFDDIFFTGYNAKDNFMKSQNIKIDIWIDDYPYSIVGNLSYRNSMH